MHERQPHQGIAKCNVPAPAARIGRAPASKAWHSTWPAADRQATLAQPGIHRAKKKALETFKGLLIDFVSGVADGARTHDNRNHNPGL
ncbi:MAG: hypothetical protein RR720_22320, partial [Comamonas sp.]|uniref:hypothetical protein n=1 Tax=Comamonas sp. TaxID=34028 RepID=UPI002FC7F66B